MLQERLHLAGSARAASAAGGPRRAPGEWGRYRACCIAPKSVALQQNGEQDCQLQAVTAHPRIATARLSRALEAGQEENAMRFGDDRESTNFTDDTGRGGLGFGGGGGGLGCLIPLVFSRFGIGGVVVLLVGSFLLRSID